MCLCGFGSFYWINNAISGIIVLHWESHPPNEMMTTSCWAKACANAQPAVALANIQGRETVCKTCIIFTLLLQIHFADSGLCHSKTDISVIFNAPHIKYKSMFTSLTLCKKSTWFGKYKRQTRHENMFMSNIVFACLFLRHSPLTHPIAWARGTWIVVAWFRNA